MQKRTTFYALFHWVNLAYLSAVTYATLHTGDTRVLGAGLVLEALWLTAGARTSGFQRYAALRNGQIDKKLKAVRSLEAQAQMSYEYKGRYRNLEKAKQQIIDAAKANKRLEMEAIQPELDKIDELLASFIRISVAHKKLTLYLQQNPESGLRNDVEVAKRKIAENPNPDAMLKQSLEGQLEVAEKRHAEHAKIQSTEKALAIQLDTIEKTMDFLKTKIVSLERPSELSNEIQNVVMGVEAAERTLDATDKIDDEIRRLEQRAALRS